MTHIIYREGKAVFRKDAKKHFFVKFNGYGLNKDDIFEMVHRKVNQIVLIVCEETTETPYYTTPFEWLAKGHYYLNDNKGIKEEQVIMPITEMKTCC